MVTCGINQSVGGNVKEHVFPPGSRKCLCGEVECPIPKVKWGRGPNEERRQRNIKLAAQRAAELKNG